MFHTRKLILYRTGQYFSFWWIKSYWNTLKLYHSKYRTMSGVLANIGHFRRKVKTGQYKKLLKKKNKKNKTKHKSTRWLTLPSGPTLLCWSLLTFSRLSLRLPSPISSVHFPSFLFFFFFFFFWSSSYLLFRLQLTAPPWSFCFVWFL